MDDDCDRAAQLHSCVARVIVTALCALPITAVVLLVRNAPETLLAGCTLGVCSALLLFGFVACAGAMHQLDEYDDAWEYDVGGGWVGVGAALPALAAVLLWVVQERERRSNRKLSDESVKYTVEL